MKGDTWAFGSETSEQKPRYMASTLYGDFLSQWGSKDEMGCPSEVRWPRCKCGFHQHVPRTKVSIIPLNLRLMLKFCSGQNV
jgi:hypothetical protein